jgi:hypothetical protein
MFISRCIMHLTGQAIERRGYTETLRCGGEERVTDAVPRPLNNTGSLVAARLEAQYFPLPLSSSCRRLSAASRRSVIARSSSFSLSCSSESLSTLL